MRAVFYDRQGSARDVLQIGFLPDPEPQCGEVRVKVAVSGLNPSDVKNRTGFTGAPMPFPRIVPHQDAAGTIDKVGPGVPNTLIGERVWVYKAQTGKAFGSAAEYVVVPAAHVVRLADSVSFDTGACLGVAAMTAHRCLFADGDLRGKRVLVQGGAGAVGNAAILLAKWAGAWVAATVGRDEQAEVAGAAGADLVINRHEENIAEKVKAATNGQGVEHIVDVDLVANIDVAVACLARDGIAAAYATEDAGARLSIPFIPALRGGLAFRFVYFYTMPEVSLQKAADEIAACAASGAYRPTIAMKLPLDQIVDAHEAQENGKTIGKILIEL
ncbi:NADPH:quinone reductase [Rhizobium sp. SG570]|uniref:NADPH:quinone reductase n=1 Tax=Rhizobium sp. SG570 TaxID=2587113 RepID=UPI0014454A9F|nr:NADPH:quinone reductase [Rhizobium sp. SG570]NKJ36667.1 NADPH:quinone reductase-like Zn-dependent oxidoreductase [Rhizobium sp. SG570]